MHEAFEPECNKPGDETDLSYIIRKIWTGRKTMVITIIVCLAIGLGWYSYRVYLVPAQFESHVTCMIESSAISQDDLVLKAKKGDTEEIIFEFTRDSVNPELVPMIVSSTLFLSRIGNILVPKPGSGSFIPVVRLPGLEKADAAQRQAALSGMITAKSGPGRTLTLRVIMPDQVISSIVADSAAACLPPFILQFSTRKATINLNFIIGLKEQADSAYLAALQAISAFHAHTSIPMLQRKELEEKRLQAAYKIALDRVSFLAHAVEKAEFRLQAQTPSITITQPATHAVRVNVPNLLLILVVSIFSGILIGMIILYVKDIQWAPAPK